MYKSNSVLRDERMRLLDESLMLIERLKKMRAVNANPKYVGIDPHILRVSGLGRRDVSGYIARLYKRIS